MQYIPFHSTAIELFASPLDKYLVEIKANWLLLATLNLGISLYTLLSDIVNNNILYW